MKSGGFVAHENLDVVNMAIRKQTASSLRLVYAAPCFVNEQKSNSREQEKTVRKTGLL